MRELRPHVVFTWDPTGGYGHPDHVAVHRYTLAAFDAADDPARFRETGIPWAPGRLYWGAFTMKRFAGMYLELERRGLLPEPLDPERRARFEQAMAAPDTTVSHVVDVHGFVDQKRAAAGMHRSQFRENSLFARIPEDMRMSFYAEERFLQARPVPTGEVGVATGLEALLPPALG